MDDFECEGMNVLHKGVTFKGRLGYGSYLGENCNLNAVIGRYCSIASNVVSIGGIHPSSVFVSTHPCFYSTKKQAGFTFVENTLFQENVMIDSEGHLIVVGNDVWIGERVMILPGVHIGDGAIIAAGAVVTKNVEPYTIVGGIPARLIRKRFTEYQITRLLDIQWWNKTLNWIQANAESFNNIECFITSNDVLKKKEEIDRYEQSR